MIVVDPNAVHDHATVVIVLHAAGIALGAVMHARTLVHIAFLTVPKLSIVLHLIIDHRARVKIVIEKH